jgi:hypothetical protein
VRGTGCRRLQALRCVVIAPAQRRTNVRSMSKDRYSVYLGGFRSINARTALVEEDNKASIGSRPGESSSGWHGTRGVHARDASAPRRWSDSDARIHLHLTNPPLATHYSHHHPLAKLIHTFVCLPTGKIKFHERDKPGLLQ